MPLGLHNYKETYELWNKIVQIAKIGGFSLIYFETIPSLIDALSLYEKFGFK